MVMISATYPGYVCITVGENKGVMQQSLEGTAILVADDEPSIRELLQDILELDGARVYLARTGQEALSMIERCNPDLAILDIQMPPPDGLAILQQLRGKGNNVPVLIITAHDVSGLALQVLQRGANDYVTKPFDPDKILLAVSRVLQQSQ